MAGKRIRDFKRISLSANTAKFLVEHFVDKTFADHFGRCSNLAPEDGPCSHERRGTLSVARVLESGLKIGKKRATLDIRCPYSTSDYTAQIALLKRVAERIQAVPLGTHKQQAEAIQRIAQEIEDYADRNPMQVIAEAAR